MRTPAFRDSLSQIENFVRFSEVRTQVLQSTIYELMKSRVFLTSLHQWLQASHSCYLALGDCNASLTGKHLVIVHDNTSHAAQHRNMTSTPVEI